MAINLLLLGILMILVYVLAQELVGRGWALLPALLTILSPYFLINSPLTALALFVALFSFLELLSHPNKLKILIAGAALGGAQSATDQAWLLWLYFLIVMTIFYFLSVTRDWPITAVNKRQSRFLVRGFRCYRSLLIIFVVGSMIFYLGHLLYNSFDWPIANERFLSFYDLKPAVISPIQKVEGVEGLEYSWPTVALAAVAVLFFLSRLPHHLKSADLIQLLNNYFPTLALLVFAALYFYFYRNIGAISPVVYLLIAAPLKNFITAKNKKEVVIVIAHEIFSFSAKWLILLSLLFWYLVNSFYFYFH